MSDQLPRLRRIIRALEILAQYNEGADTCAEHDVFYVSVPWESITLPDRDELRALGFDRDGYDGCRMFT